jgi:hypothetical protein
VPHLASHVLVIGKKNEWATVEEEQQARQAALEEQFKTLQAVLPDILKKFDRIPDPRRPRSTRHKLTVVLLFGLLFSNSLALTLVITTGSFVLFRMTLHAFLLHGCISFTMFRLMMNPLWQRKKELPASFCSNTSIVSVVLTLPSMVWIITERPFLVKKTISPMLTNVFFPSSFTSIFFRLVC